MVNPQIRRHLVSKTMGDGLGIVDVAMQRSYIFNATSALVFQHCDGETTPEQMAELMQHRFNVPQGEARQMVWLALGELEKFELLQR